MIERLKLIRGLRPAVGDTNTGESIKQQISLLADEEGKNTWSLVNDRFWMPDIAQHKSGVWSESNFTPGRELQGTDLQNVVEKIDLHLTASSADDFANAVRDMGNFMREARMFWTHGGLEPSYIEFELTGAEGPQYALIYFINMQISKPGDAKNYTRDVTLTIEREPCWRVIPPGANPKIWTRYLLGQYEGKDYTWAGHSGGSPIAPDSAGYSLLNDPSLVEQTIQNRMENDNSNWTTLNSQNFVTIEANDIRGDSPADLLMVIDSIDAEITENFEFIVTKSTNPISVADGSTTRYQTSTLNLLSCTTSGHELTNVPTAANDTGGLEGASTSFGDLASKSRVEIDPDNGAGLELALSWNEPLRSNLYRGRYGVFVRCRQDSGSEGDCTMQVRFSNKTVRLSTDEVNVPVQAGTGNTSRWEVAYMGEVYFPVDTSPVIIETSGKGRVSTYDDLQMTLFVQRSTGAALIYFCDIVLMKIDEAAMHLIPVENALSSEESDLIIYDTTGYMMHGKPDPYARSMGATSEDWVNPIELRGTPIKITPGVDNHLFFFVLDSNGQSDALQEFTVRLHVSPRYCGYRAKSDIVVTVAGETPSDPDDDPFSTGGSFTYDGANDYTDLYSAAFETWFPHDEGWIFMKLKVANAGVWSDGTEDRALLCLMDGSNMVLIRKLTSGNVGLQRIANGTSQSISIVGESTTSYITYQLAWSVTDDYLRVTRNGIQQGVDQTGLVAMNTTTMDTSRNNIGAGDNSPIIQVWNGDMEQFIIGGKAAANVPTVAEQLDIYNKNEAGTLTPNDLNGYCGSGNWGYAVPTSGPTFTDQGSNAFSWSPSGVTFNP